LKLEVQTSYYTYKVKLKEKNIITLQNIILTITTFWV